VDSFWHDNCTYINEAKNNFTNLFNIVGGIIMSEILASMAGNVWKVLVKAGERVEEGQDVMILESMKMEIPIEAETTGVVKVVNVNEGDFVNEGDIVVEVE
jgi:acetyl-CoA carboxylase biotin carboxyl carrier protein